MTRKKSLQWLDRNVALLGPYLILCLRPQDYKEALRQIHVKPVGPWVLPDKCATVHICRRPNGELAAVVCMRPDPRPLSEALGMLVHEATHVWQHYAAELGETESGDEQEAVAIQMIAQELMYSFLKQTRCGKYGHFPKK